MVLRSVIRIFTKVFLRDYLNNTKTEEKEINIESLISVLLKMQSFINLKYQIMKLNFASVALAFILPAAVYGQDSTAVAKTTASQGQYPNEYTSGSANVSPFTNK